MQRAGMRRSRTGRRAGASAVAAAAAFAAALRCGRPLAAGAQHCHPAFVSGAPAAAAATARLSTQRRALGWRDEGAAAGSCGEAASEQGQGAFDWLRATALIGAVCVALLGPPSGIRGLPGQPQAAWAKGTSSMGDRVNKDPISLLQIALPLEEVVGEKEVKTVRALQADVENIKANVLLRLWGNCKNSVDEAVNLVNKQKDQLLKPVPADRKAEAEAVVAKLQPQIDELQKAIDKGLNAEQATFRDEEAAASTTKVTEDVQKLVGELEETLLPKGYASPTPADVPANLPRLNGRATVEIKLKKGDDSRKFALDDKVFEEATLQIIADGYSAPISAGNWIDLVDRGFYTGMKIQRADGFIIQTGASTDKDQGFRPSPDAKTRTIPLEVGVVGKKQAIYGETLDEARQVGAQVRIPFQADGVISMARAEFDNDSASSQFFMIIFESDMTPAGKNLLDGRYGSFGYTVDGALFLRQVGEGDVIVSAKVISGIENLKRPA